MQGGEIAAAEEAESLGLGVVSPNGKMIDGPIIDHAQVVARCRLPVFAIKEGTMKETVTMLNQQYVVPKRFHSPTGGNMNSPWLASENVKKRRRASCDSLEEAIRRSA